MGRSKLEIYLARTHLSANTQEAKFWASNADTIACYLALRTKSPRTYAAELSRALQARGLILSSVHDVVAVDDTASPELLEVIHTVEPNAPLLFGRIHDAAKQHCCRIVEQNSAEITPSNRLWALLDGVAWPSLPSILAASGNPHISLYSSTDEATLASGPWLVQLQQGGSMYDQILRRSPNEHSGILFESSASITQLRRHWRRFTMVTVPNGSTAPVYFRFYDPRVLLNCIAALLPTQITRLMDLVDVLYAPLSAQTILPDHALISRVPTPFDKDEGLQGRFASITLETPANTPSRGSFTVSELEFQKFRALQKRQAERRLAQQMSFEYKNRPWADYRAAAKGAAVAGPKFSLTSNKQVAALARAIILRGPEFWLHSPAAAAILTKENTRPWQKKNALLEWLVSDTQERKVGQ